MASTEIVKTVHIETGGGERSVKSLREEIRQLRDALLNMDQGGEEWVATAQQLTQAQNDLNTVMRAGKGDFDATSDSIAGMEAQYKSLYNTYKLLGSEARETAEGLAMRNQLAELSNNINNAKQSVGNFKSNIGNYSKSIMDAFNAMGKSVGGLNGPLKAAGASVKSFGMSLKSLAANPVGAVIMAIVVALKALTAIAARVKKAIAQNEDYQKRMNKAMAAFKPIGDLVAKVFDKLAGVVVKVAEGAAKVVSWFHKLIPAANELNEAEQKIVDTENELIDVRREVEVLNSEDEAEVQTLWEQASATEDVKEKQELLAEAKAKQEEINKRNIELAQKELDLLILQSSVRPNSIEDNNKIAQAQANLNKAIANGERAIRRLNNAGRSARSAGHSAAKDTKEDLDSILERLEQNSKTEIQVLTEKYEEEKKLLEKYHKDTTKLTEEYARNIQNIQDAIDLAIIGRADQNRQAYFGTLVQPSHEAFTKIRKDAENTRDYLMEDLEDIGLAYDNVNKSIVGLLFDENNNFMGFGTAENAAHIFKPAIGGVKEFTEAFHDLNIQYGLGVTTGMTEVEVIDIILAKMSQLHAVARDTIKEEMAWERGMRDLLNETNLLMVQYYTSFDMDKAETLDQQFSLYQRLWVAQNQYYQDAVDRASEYHDTLIDLYNKGGEKLLTANGYTLNDMLEAQNAYFDAVKTMRDWDLQNQMEAQAKENELWEQKKKNILDLTKQSITFYTTVSDAVTKGMQDSIKEGNLSEKETKRKIKWLQVLEHVQLVATLASIAYDATNSISSIWASWAGELANNAETAAATGPAAVATKTALDAKSTANRNLRVALIVANASTAAAAAVAKSVSNFNNYKSLGDETASNGTPSTIDSTPYSYTRQIQTDSEREQELNRPVYVRVTDINNVQNRVKVVEQESTF